MKNTIKNALREKCADIPNELFTKACRKLTIWMQNAYGSTDWEEAVAEMGMDGLEQSIRLYAAESNSNEYATFNREGYHNRRKNN